MWLTFLVTKVYRVLFRSVHWCNSIHWMSIGGVHLRSVEEWMNTYQHYLELINKRIEKKISLFLSNDCSHSCLYGREKISSGWLVFMWCYSINQFKTYNSNILDYGKFNHFSQHNATNLNYAKLCINFRWQSFCFDLQMFACMFWIT